MDSKEKELTFEEWSSMWDKIFYICERRENFKALVVHTLRYKPRWNRGL